MHKSTRARNGPSNALFIKALLRYSPIADTAAGAGPPWRGRGYSRLTFYQNCTAQDFEKSTRIKHPIKHPAGALLIKHPLSGCFIPSGCFMRALHAGALCGRFMQVVYAGGLTPLPPDAFCSLRGTSLFAILGVSALESQKTCPAALVACTSRFPAPSPFERGAGELRTRSTARASPCPALAVRASLDACSGSPPVARSNPHRPEARDTYPTVAAAIVTAVEGDWFGFTG